MKHCRWQLKKRPTTSPASSAPMVAVPSHHPTMQPWRGSSTASTISLNFSRRREATTIWSSAHRSSVRRHSLNSQLLIPLDPCHFNSGVWRQEFGSLLFLLKTTWLYVMPSSPEDTGLLYFGIFGCASWITLVNHGTVVIFNEIVVHPILKSGILPLLIDILLCCLAILYCSLVTYLRIIPCFRILFGWVDFASLKIGRKVTCFWRILFS